MKSNLIFFLSIIVLFSSCEKDKAGNLRFYGVVIDAKDNMSVPGSRIDIYAHPGGIRFHDSTWSDKNGFYDFTIPDFAYADPYPDRLFGYQFFLTKEGYLRYPHNQANYFIYVNSIKRNEVNIDTITIWREAMLKIELNSLDSTYNYIINSSIDRQTTEDSIFQFLPWPHKIDPNYTLYTLMEGGENIYKLRNVIYYLYDFSPQVNITWYKYRGDWEEYDTVYNSEAITIDLIPFDTVYLSLE